MLVLGILIISIASIVGLAVSLPLFRMSIRARANTFGLFVLVAAIGAGVAGSERNGNLVGNVVMSLMLFVGPALGFRWGMRRFMSHAKAQYIAAQSNRDSWGYSFAAGIARMYISNKDLEAP